MKNLLIIVPYGNLNPEEKRDTQLKMFLSHFKILWSKEKKHHIFILISEQITPKKYFNRGQIVNIGLKYFKENFGTPQTMIVHDVDILPNENMFRKYFTISKLYNLVAFNSITFKKTYNISNLPSTWGIFLTIPKFYILCNGFPNNFWGWGYEDVALDYRYKINKIFPKFNYDKNDDYISTDIQRNNNSKDKSIYLKKNKIKNMMTKELSKENKITWKKNGYNQLSKYIVTNETVDEFFNLKIIKIQVKLNEVDLLKNIKFNEKIYKLYFN